MQQSDNLGVTAVITGLLLACIVVVFSAIGTLGNQRQERIETAAASAAALRVADGVYVEAQGRAALNHAAAEISQQAALSVEADRLTAHPALSEPLTPSPWVPFLAGVVVTLLVVIVVLVGVLLTRKEQLPTPPEAES